MKFDNAIIHYYPLSPFAAKAAVNIRAGDKIVFKTALRDDDAAREFLESTFPGVPFRVVVHM